MIRFALLGGLVLALCGAASADDKKEVPKELAPFQGKWKVAEASFGGQPAPKEELNNLKFTFEGDKLIVGEKGREDKGSYAVDPKKDPATIDLISPKGDKALGIYKFDKNGKLTLCFVKGAKTGRPKGFDDKEAVLMVLEKESK